MRKNASDARKGFVDAPAGAAWWRAMGNLACLRSICGRETCTIVRRVSETVDYLHIRPMLDLSIPCGGANEGNMRSQLT
jgi:hypothetical protein